MLLLLLLSFGCGVLPLRHFFQFAAAAAAHACLSLLRMFDILLLRSHSAAAAAAAAQVSVGDKVVYSSYLEESSQLKIGEDTFAFIRAADIAAKW